jgi:hypothetical protein
MLTYALEQALQSADEERRLWKEEEALLTSAHLASARWMLAQCVTHARTRLCTFLRQVPAAAGCGSAANAASAVGAALGHIEFARCANSTSREGTPGASATSCDALVAPAAAAVAGGGAAAGAQEDARTVAEACKGVDEAFDAAADVLSEVRVSFIHPCCLNTALLAYYSRITA